MGHLVIKEVFEFHRFPPRTERPAESVRRVLKTYLNSNSNYACLFCHQRVAAFA